MDSEATRLKKRAAALARSPEDEARRLAASKAALNTPEVRQKLSDMAKKKALKSMLVRPKRGQSFVRQRL